MFYPLGKTQKNLKGGGGGGVEAPPPPQPTPPVRHILQHFEKKGGRRQKVNIWLGIFCCL